MAWKVEQKEIILTRTLAPRGVGSGDESRGAPVK